MAMLLLFGNVAYGLGFLLFYWTDAVKKSTLFQSLDQCFGGFGQAWGAMVLVAALLCVWDACDRMRHRYARRVGAGLGMVMWGYGSLMFLFSKFYLVFLTVGMVYFMFWFWYYCKFVKKYTGDDWQHLLPDFRH